MTDKELLMQARMGLAWIDCTPGHMAWPWNWHRYLSIDTIPVNRSHLMMLLGRLETLLEEQIERDRRKLPQVHRSSA